MRNCQLAGLIAYLLLGAPTAFGQLIQQTVQLPTFSSFSVGTTVSIPDSGQGFVGGVKRSAQGSNRFGVPGLNRVPGAGPLFSNRAMGSDSSSSTAHVSATIIDRDEWDRAILDAAAARRGSASSDPAIAQKAAFLSQHIARIGRTGTAPLNVERTSPGARPQPATAEAGLTAAARDAFRLGRQAEANGHFAQARTSYQRAATLGDGEVRDQAEARLAALSQPQRSLPRTSPR